MARTHWNWFHSQAANSLALSRARSGARLETIMDEIKATNWLPDRCIYPCAMQAIELAYELNQQDMLATEYDLDLWLNSNSTGAKI